MKIAILISVVAIMSLGTGAAFADSVHGYARKDGTYVQGYNRSAPDEIRSNNYGSQSNGGRQRDEYSAGTGATNTRNGSYGSRDNDRDGVYNTRDRYPETKSRY